MATALTLAAFGCAFAVVESHDPQPIKSRRLGSARRAAQRAVRDPSPKKDRDARSEFRPVRLLGPLPPITDFPVVPVAEIGDRLKGEELVIGVTVNGKSRAYPINMLVGPRREILNDRLGGRPIAATW